MLCGSDFSATFRFFSSIFQKSHNSGENAQRKTQFHMASAHRTPETPSGGIFYPSMVPDPHSKMHAKAVIKIPPREVI